MNLPTPQSQSEKEDRLPTRIVGLGASEGGLEPLEQFLAHVPVPSGLVYVVVQHLDPTHKAMLTELLQRVTSMPVREITASMRVEPHMPLATAVARPITVEPARHDPGIDRQHARRAA